MEIVPWRPELLRIKAKLLRVLQRGCEFHKLSIDEVIGVMSALLGELIENAPAEVRGKLREAAIFNLNLQRDAAHPPAPPPMEERN